MSEGPAFHGSPRTGGRTERRITAIVVGLIMALVAVAIVKPWGNLAEPEPSGRLPRIEGTPTATLLTPSQVAPSPAPSVEVRPLPVAFTTPFAPAASAIATWTGIDWRRLAPGDPLSLVTSVSAWRRGFVAVGLDAELPSTPVWTSADGIQWDVLPPNTATTFWPGHAVLGVADLPAGLVALTETVEFCGRPCPLSFELPVVSWTSPDGRSWAPHVLPPEWLARPSGQAPLIAVGRAGLVVASTGTEARIATSTDGSRWDLVPAHDFPARFALRDLRATATGYVAVGRWPTPAGRLEPASLSSSDGRRWSTTPAIMPASPEAGSDVASLVVGRTGMVAVGRGPGPGAVRWWGSATGRAWQALPSFSPLGPATCNADGCGSEPDGVLVGDGTRMVAIQGGSKAGAWTSSDGRTWQRLAVGGDVPRGRATRAYLLPGGVLLTDGTSVWFGVAHGN